MKKIVVAGIGAIGSIVGSHLSVSGRDVLLFEPFWREHAETMKKNGLVMTDAGGERRVKVNVLFADEISTLRDKIDILFISVKSNDTETVLKSLMPHMDKGFVVMSLQNGINEDIIIPIAGREHTVAGVSYTGGKLLRPGFASGHDGYFVIGELDGSKTERIKELAEILMEVKSTRISSNIMQERWSKLAQVTMSVPVACISGLGLREVFQNTAAHRLMAGAMHETMQVAAAAGYKLGSVIGITSEDLGRLARVPSPDVSSLISAGGDHFPPGATDAMTSDIRKGLKLEIDYTNGYVVAKGKELGIHTPANTFILSTVKGIERGIVKPGLDNLRKFPENC